MAKTYQKIKRLVELSTLKINLNKKAFLGVKERIKVVELAKSGMTLAEIAFSLDRSISWVKKWIARFNIFGPDGLLTRKATGQPEKLPEGSKGEAIILEMVKNGPPENSSLSRYRVQDFQNALAAEGIIVSSFAIRRKLKLLGYSYKTSRPVHPKNDPAKMEQWKKDFPVVVEKEKKKAQEEGKELVVYFEDEARFGQKGYLTRTWSITGERTEEIKQNQFTSGYMITAASPQTGHQCSIVTDCLDSAVMNIFLSTFSESLPANTQALLIVDQAGWHTSNKLEVPGNITLHYLPPYSPQLNPIENLWGYIKSNFLSGRVYSDIYDIFDKGCKALNSLTESIIKSVCHRSWIDELDTI